MPDPLTWVRGSGKKMEGVYCIHDCIPMAKVPLYDLKPFQYGMGAGIRAMALKPSADDVTEGERQSSHHQEGWRLLP